MNLIEAVTLADVIYLDEIDFSQQVNSPIDLGLPTGPIVIRGRCVPKTPGQLRFKLNSVRDLNVQEPFDFDIEFVGTPSPTGEPVVQWSVDHQYDQYYSVPGEPADFHIWDVKGSVTTTLASITPPRDGQACDGAERVFPVIVAMAAGQNELIVRGDAVTEGLHDHLFDVTLTDTDISVTGSAGFAPRRVNVFIRPENGACGSGGTIPGGHVRFWAAVAYSASTTLAFKWSVNGSGAVLAGGSGDGQWAEVVLGDTPGDVVISVDVTADDGSVTTASLQYTPETRVEAALARLACVLKEFKLPPVLRGDPARRLKFSRADLRELHTFAASVLALTRHLLQPIEGAAGKALRLKAGRGGR